MTRVIGNRTQSRICGSRYKETLQIDLVSNTTRQSSHNTNGVLGDMTVDDARLARLPFLVGRIAAAPGFHLFHHGQLTNHTVRHL